MKLFSTHRPALLRCLPLAAALAFALAQTPVHAANEACEKQAADKKLAGAAKNSFLKKCETDAAAAAPAAKPSAAEVCEKQAAEKKLAGAAKNSFMKKCETDASAATAAAPKK
ncbi:MAG: hypothetical protein ACKOCJ_02755 [Burkholderiaceae bacterium]